MSAFDEQPDAPLHGECAAEIARLGAVNTDLLAERDKLRQDVLTLALRLYCEDDDMNAPETREVLARWRPAVNAEIARRTA